MRSCQPWRRAGPVADRTSRMAVTGQAGRGRDGVVMPMTVGMHLVLGIPGHVAGVSAMFPAASQVSLVMMLGAIRPTWPARVARCSAQRGRSGEASEVKVRSMRSVTMRVSTVRSVLHHLLMMMARVGREQAHTLHRAEHWAGQGSKVESLSDRSRWIIKVIVG